MPTSSKRIRPLFAVWFFALVWSGCGGGEMQEPWREQKLPGGRSIKVKSLQIAWGVQHDEPRRAERDCFVLQFVHAAPAGDDEARAREVQEVFELIRPVSEQWGFASAELMAYATTEPSRHYDLWVFSRRSDGTWVPRREQRF